MRIFAGGVATESNTFAAVPTGLQDFLVQRGSDVLEGRIDYPTLDLSEVWGRQAHEAGHEFIFGLMAWAQPGGMTVKQAYETLRDELLQSLQVAMPVDIVLLNLHGAMVAQGYDDCEEDMIRRVREIVGADAIIGVELDLHCHLTESMIAAADIVITYKEYPHVDGDERARELFDLAVAAKRGEIKPVMALFDCHMAGLYPTTREPLRTFVDDMMKAEGHDGVLSVSFGHGFQFADLPQMGAKVLVVADADTALAARVAEEFGRRVHAMRREIGFDSMSLPLDEALTRAMAAPRGPVVVADQSDNTGGGASGDSTFALRWLLEHDAKGAAISMMYDPEVVNTVKRAGVGATLSLRIGGKLGAASGDPVDFEAEVLAIEEDYMHAFPQQSGPPVYFPAGDVVAIRAGEIDIVVTSERCQCFSPMILSDLGIDPHDKQLIVVKSVQHFYSAFAPIASEILYMSAPGAVPPNPRQLSFKRFNPANRYPWEAAPQLN